MKIDDEEVISEMKALVQSKYGDTVGHELDGRPINKAELISQIEAAEKRIDSGKYISQRDLERESANWG